eukprot:g1313.t1
MVSSFKCLSTEEGLTQLNEHLAPRSYISGYQASNDDLAVYAALTGPPEAGKYTHAARWYKHIKALVGASFPGKGEGVKIEGASGDSVANGSKAVGAEEEIEPDIMADDDDDDEDLDLFGEMTEEEKAAKEEQKKIIEAKKAKAKANAAKAKSMIIIDVKPWDDTTDMKQLEDEVRKIEKDGLLWGQSKLVPVGFGIKKLQITAVIEDVKIPSFDAIIEDDLVKDGDSENIQSVDIVAFNKI